MEQCEGKCGGSGTGVDDSLLYHLREDRSDLSGERKHVKGDGKECGKKNKHHWIIRQKWLAGRARHLKTLGSKARKAKESIRATSSLYTCSARTNTIGPIIMSYVSSRPSTLSYCGDDDSLGPCLGPQCDRWKRRENYLPDWLCKCDGNGFCAASISICAPILSTPAGANLIPSSVYRDLKSTGVHRKSDLNPSTTLMFVRNHLGSSLLVSSLLLKGGWPPWAKS